MIRLITITVFLLGTITTQAIPFKNLINNHIIKNVKAKVSKAKKTQTQCADFSGAWSGQCTISTKDGDQNVQFNYLITQDGCSSMTTTNPQTHESHQTFLGSVESEQTHVSNLGINSVHYSDWNADGKEIIARGNFLFKVTEPMGQVFEGEGVSRIYIENGQIKSETRVLDVAMVCAGTKQ